MANRYTKISGQGVGGHPAYSTDVPKFPDISSYLSNMDKIRSYNEHYIKKATEAQEDASKLHLGLLKYFDGTEAYFSKYKADKQEFNKIVDDYHKELEEISKNPNDPYINVKVAEIGTKMSQNLSSGKLGAILNNAKVYNQRLKDLEDNKQYIGLDPAMSKEFDEENEDFSSTVQYTEKGEEKLNYLKYIPLAPFLDIDKGLHNHMSDTKPSTLENPKPLEVVRLEGDGHGRYVIHKQDIGVNDSMAYKQVKSYFDSLAANSDSEYKRRLIKEFEKEANGKDYIIVKDTDGNEIKQGLSDFIDKKNHEQAWLRKNKYVFRKTDEKVDRVNYSGEQADLAIKQADLVTEQWRTLDIKDAIRSRRLRDDIATKKYLNSLEDDEDEDGEGGRSKKSKKDIPSAMPFEGSEEVSILDKSYMEPAGVPGKSKMTDEGLDKLNSTKDPNYHNFLLANKKYKSSINDNAGSFTTQINKGLYDIGWKPTDKFNKEFVHTYLLELSDPLFRSKSNSEKAKHILEKLNKLPVSNANSKIHLRNSINYYSKDDNLDILTTAVKKIEGMSGLSLGDRVVNPKDYYKEFIAETLNVKEKKPEVVLNLINMEQKKSNQEFLNDVYGRKKDELEGLTFKEFIGVMEGNPISLGSKSISFTIPIKDKDGKTYKKQIEVTEPHLVKGYTERYAKEAIKAGTHDSPVPQFYQFPVNKILERQGAVPQYESFINNPSYNRLEIKDKNRETALIFHNINNREALSLFSRSNDYNKVKEELINRGLISKGGGVVEPFIVTIDSLGEVEVSPYSTVQSKKSILNKYIKEVK